MSLLQVRNLSKAFGGVRAVDDISFDLAAGELLALIGPNGAGKSTTFNMVGGQLPATTGSVRLDGHELVGMRPRDIWRLGVGRTFQIAATFASLTVVENVQMALLSHHRRIFSFGSRYWRCSNRWACATRPSGPAASWPMATSSGSSWPWGWPMIPSCC